MRLSPRTIPTGFNVLERTDYGVHEYDGQAKTDRLVFNPFGDDKTRTSCAPGRCKCGALAALNRFGECLACVLKTNIEVQAASEP